ncbi:MAG TPA: transcriptional regulator [Pseudonocardiaceae bacterium]|nr:transcriptional regulator [Pseudonocardiaceae bacterium]
MSFTRLQQLLALTPGNLITHLRKLDEAGYVTSAKSRGDDGIRTAVHLTHRTSGVRTIFGRPAAIVGAPQSGQIRASPKYGLSDETGGQNAHLERS